MNTVGKHMHGGPRRALIAAAIALPLLAGTGAAQTVSGGVASDTTWSGNVRIDDSVWVTAGTIVTIEPGTQLSFDQNGGLTVLGALQAPGTAQDTIVFTAADTSVGWRGLSFPSTTDPTTTSSFAYCRFEYAIDTSTYAEGGAVFVDERESMHFSNCVFQRNQAYRGAGLFSERTTLYLSDCLFLNNEGESYGTALCGYGRLTMTGCTVAGNRGGRAVRWSATSEWVAMISGCAFIDNTINGAIEANSSTTDAFWITGSLFRGNQSRYDAGAIRFDGHNHGDNLQVVNCTFVENVGHDNDNALYCLQGMVVLTNCIVWDGAGEELRGNTSAYSVRYCCIKGGFTGTQVIDTTPLFADSAGGDFSLAEGSPCIDAGSPMIALLVLPETDLAGNPRIAGASIDIGAYESEPATTTRGAPTLAAPRTRHRTARGMLYTLNGRTPRGLLSRGCYPTKEGLVGWWGLENTTQRAPRD